MRQRAAIDPGGAHRGERRRLIALGEAAAVFVADERVVEIAWLRQVEQFLQQPLDGSRRAQVDAANDDRYATRGIVDNAGEMVGREGVLARQDRVADVGGGPGEARTVGLAPAGDAADARDRGGGIEPPAVGCGGAARGVVGLAAAGPRIGCAGVAMGGGERGGDIGAGAEAWVDQLCVTQAVERGVVGGDARGLDERGRIGGEAEPGEVLEDAVDERGAAARGVEILDAQEPALAVRAAEGGAVGVAEVEAARWGRGEAGGDHGLATRSFPAFAGEVAGEA